MKIKAIALTCILAAGLLTACRAPATDNATTPDTSTTRPSTSATTPTTTATTPTTSAPTTIPTPSGTDGTTEGRGGINSMDPRKAMPGPMMPGMPNGMPSKR